MSAIMMPEGWEVKRLSELANIVGGGTPAREEEEYWKNGNIPWATPTDITKEKTGKYIDKTEECITAKGLSLSSAKLIPVNSILLTSRANIGFMRLNTIPMATNQGFASVVPFEDNAQFLYYLLDIYVPYMHRRAYGTTFPEISKTEVKNIPIVIPKSAYEQQKIATILSSLDRTIEATQKLIDKEKMVKKGLMADLLTHGIDEQGRIRSPQTHKYVDSPLGKIPEGWNTTTLGDTAIFNAGYAFKNHELSEYGLKVVRISNLHKSSFPYWHYDGKIKKTWIVDKGDLLFSWAGVANSIDCVKYEGELALLNQHIFNLKIKDQVLKEFTFQYLQFHLPRLREEIEGGAGQLHLTKSKIESICIPDMKLLEKKKIVELFTAQDRKIETEETSLAKLQNLKKGLMGDLLSGKVRVKG